MMPNLKQILAGPVSVPTAIVSKGWTESDAYRELDRITIEAHSYLDETDRVLARYERVDKVLPDPDVLEEQGVDLHALASGLESGLSAQAFAKALGSGLDTGLFFQAVRRGQVDLELANTDMLSRENDEQFARFNEGLLHLSDLYNESPRHRRWVQNLRPRRQVS
jgi:hypothetical protein